MGKNITTYTTHCAKEYFTRAPARQRYNGRTVRGFAPREKPKSKDTTAVRPWSFIFDRNFREGLNNSGLHHLFQLQFSAKLCPGQRTRISGHVHPAL